MFRIKRGDKVIVITGKDKGKIGTVFRIFNKGFKKFTALVSGIKIVKKHFKKNEKNISSGIYNIETCIDLSNLAIYNEIIKYKDKIRGKLALQNKRFRAYKSSGLEIK